jgi:DNA helicase II / ATP-dependent DNA helicase PcrA
MKTVFESHPSAPEGAVENLGLYEASHFTKGSAILCRNTAPLVAFAYSLLQRDVPCRILGKDIGASLITIIKKLRATNLEDLQERLKTWEAREVDRCHRDDRSPEPVYDKCECIRYFISSLDEESQSVSDLVAKIELMFTDATNGESSSRVTLSTIHKAKGLEYPTVFLLNWHLLPSRFAQQEWQQVQERNLQYVAITRSKNKLIYINSESWKD